MSAQDRGGAPRSPFLDLTSGALSFFMENHHFTVLCLPAMNPGLQIRNPQAPRDIK